MRDYWLALDARQGRPVRVAADIATTDETVEALTAGLGVCLVAAGNAPLVTRDGITTVPISGVTPSRLVLLWRREDTRPLLAALASAIRQAIGD